jgi:hypothetical protein
VTQETRLQLQVDLEFELQAKSRMSASCDSSLTELVLDDVKDVAVARIQAVKDLGRVIALFSVYEGCEPDFSCQV